jgi:hypothetical protein
MYLIPVLCIWFQFYVFDSSFMYLIPVLCIWFQFYVIDYSFFLVWFQFYVFDSSLTLLFASIFKPMYIGTYIDWSGVNVTILEKNVEKMSTK